MTRIQSIKLILNYTFDLIDIKIIKLIINLFCEPQWQKMLLEINEHFALFQENLINKKLAGCCGAICTRRQFLNQDKSRQNRDELMAYAKLQGYAFAQIFARSQPMRESNTSTNTVVHI
jgi:hypothetical protein